MTHHRKPYHWEYREYGDDDDEFGEGESGGVSESPTKPHIYVFVAMISISKYMIHK